MVEDTESEDARVSGANGGNGQNAGRSLDANIGRSRANR